MLSNIEEPYVLALSKHLKSDSHLPKKFVICLIERNRRNAKIVKLSHFVCFFKPTQHVRKSLLPYTAIYILNVHLEMCPEILYSAIAKYPEIFFDALKTGQNEKSYFFKKLASQKSMRD